MNTKDCRVRVLMRTSLNIRLSSINRLLCCFAVLASLVAGMPRSAEAAENLCDVAFQNCRTPLIDLINNEKVGIDVSFWFMEDARYSNAIVSRWQAGVPVRVMMDSRANSTSPNNVTILSQLQNAGIPMREKFNGGILHRKFMLFAGQNMLEFGGANYSDEAFVPIDPYVNYVDEAIYYTGDPVVVNSFKTVFDNMWTSTSGYRNYANVATTPVRNYPIYSIDPELNFPPDQNYATRSVNAYKAETAKIDVQMYRITDRRHSDAIIDAFVNRRVPVRLYTDGSEYRNVDRLWHAWNVDRMWLAGIPIKIPAHEGINHQKTVLLYGQATTIFGSSNWTSPSADSQAEHNYFTKKAWFFQWFVDQFERKWNNTNPTGVDETAWFVPLPSDKPVYKSPANGAIGLSTTGVQLVWYGGPWAHIYDVYFGTDPVNPPLLAANLALGPSQSSTQTQSFTLPTLLPGTTYYWKIVSKTAALLEKPGSIWSFTTTGSAPPPPSGGGTTVVMWMANLPAANVHGTWTALADATAAGGSALWNPNSGASKIAPALASPTNYFEQTFSANPGTAYHLWIRLRAENNSMSNDSVHLQFNDSVDQSGFAIMRIGTASSAEFVLQRGTGDTSIANWGWTDNGWGSPGTPIFFANTGMHTVRVQQREDGAIIDQIVLSPDTYLSAPPGASDNDATILASTDGTPGGGGTGAALPAGWQSSDIGAVTLAGSASASGGTFTVTGTGADIWGSADAFRYAYVQLPGDGTMVARVATVQNVNVWTKAGVMLRQTLDANSAHASMFVTPGKGLAFQRRPSTGATTLYTGILGAAPQWVRLVRAGQIVTASVSADGVSWTVVGQDTISFSGAVWVGLALTSHDTTQTATATFDNVSITAN